MVILVLVVMVIILELSVVIFQHRILMKDAEQDVMMEPIAN